MIKCKKKSFLPPFFWNESILFQLNITSLLFILELLHYYTLTSFYRFSAFFLSTSAFQLQIRPFQVLQRQAKSSAQRSDLSILSTTFLGEEQARKLQDAQAKSLQAYELTNPQAEKLTI